VANPALHRSAPLTRLSPTGLPVMAVCACPKLSIDPNSCQTNQAEIYHFRWDHAHLDKYYEHTRLLLQPVYDDLIALSGHPVSLDVNILSNRTDSIYNSFTCALRCYSKTSKKFLQILVDPRIRRIKGKISLFLQKVEGCRQTEKWTNTGSIQKRQIVI